jgi:phospholipid-binding lipoprotein MlaA
LACAAAAIAAALATSLAPAPAMAKEDGPVSYADERYYDPLEPVNRVFFRFNQVIDEMLLKPAARLYIKVVPDRGRIVVSNVIDNLKAPITLANDILQGDVHRAQITISRFTTNTILGFGGMMDVAADLGAPYHSEDFGQTLAVHGVGKGPYLMLPFFGPSTFRDAFGQFVDTFFDPLGYVLDTEEAIARAGIEGLDRRAEFLDVSEAMEKTSIDYYASIRSIFLQNREYEIRNGAPEPIVDIYGNDTTPAK